GDRARRWSNHADVSPLLLGLAHERVGARDVRLVVFRIELYGLIGVGDRLIIFSLPEIAGAAPDVGVRILRFQLNGFGAIGNSLIVLSFATERVGARDVRLVVFRIEFDGLSAIGDGLVVFIRAAGTAIAYL